ncbi:hypothetical protein JW868_02885 [Candidatus Woesearchaeota archaeon]|nr:hypothetical protein [Candidatus Woesearchaeota archaeon]
MKNLLHNRKGMEMWSMILSAIVMAVLIWISWGMISEAWAGAEQTGMCGAFTSASCYSRPCPDQGLEYSQGNCDGKYCCASDAEMLILKKATETQCQNTPYVDFSLPKGKKNEKLTKYACLTEAQTGDFIISRVYDADQGIELWEDSFVYTDQNINTKKVKAEFNIGEKMTYAWHVIQYSYYDPNKKGPEQYGNVLGESRIRVEVS